MEAIDIAAHGGVKCHYELKPLTELEKLVLPSAKLYLAADKEKSVYKGLAEGKVSGRVVLDIQQANENAEV